MSEFKVVIIQGISGEKIETPPLGPAYMAAVLEKKGCSVQIIVPNAPYFPQDYSREIVRRVQSFGPDIIGFSMYTTNVVETYRMISLLKPLGVPIIAGGPHPSLLPEEALEHDVDMVVVGEAEESILDVVEFYQGTKVPEDILGICYKDETGQVKINPPRRRIKDLDALPFPARHLYDNRDFIRCNADYERLGCLLGVRGCPGKCTYCSKNVFDMPCSRSPVSIVKEIVFLKHQYGITHFNFLDDAFSAYKRHILTFCDLIMQSDLNITWNCVTRLDHATEEMLGKMKDAGCRHVNYGFESINDATLRRIRKGFTLDKIKQAIKWTHDAGLEMDVNFIWGFPWESAEDIGRTLSFLKEYGHYFDKIMQSGVLIPFPGTQIYEEGKNVYGFEKWWLDEAANYDYNPHLHQHLAFRDSLIEKSFYNYSREQKKQLRKAARFIGRHNNRGRSQLKRILLMAAIRCSLILSRLAPAFEIKVFQRIVYSMKNAYSRYKSIGRRVQVKRS